MDPEIVLEELSKYFLDSGFNLTLKIQSSEYGRAPGTSKIVESLFPQAKSIVLVGFAGKSFDGALLVPTSGAFVQGIITNNGNIIYDETAGPRSGIALTDLVIEELPIVAPPPPPKPEPKPEECFIFANIFRLVGSTAQGAPPQVKTLVSSGKISCESADALRATGHIIEEIEEGEVAPPDVPSPTPQNPFYRDKNGNKIFITQTELGRTLRIEIKESLGFREV